MNKVKSNKSFYVTTLGTIIMLVSLGFIITYLAFGTAEATLTGVSSRTCYDGNGEYDGYEYYFKYTVDGKTYNAKRICERVPENDTFMVRYNPQNPEKTMSEFTLYMSIFTLLFGGWILYCGFKSGILLKLHSIFGR